MQRCALAVPAHTVFHLFHHPWNLTDEKIRSWSSKSFEHCTYFNLLVCIKDKIFACLLWILGSNSGRFDPLPLPLPPPGILYSVQMRPPYWILHSPPPPSAHGKFGLNCGLFALILVHQFNCSLEIISCSAMFLWPNMKTLKLRI